MWMVHGHIQHNYYMFFIIFKQCSDKTKISKQKSLLSRNGSEEPEMSYKTDRVRLRLETCEYMQVNTSLRVNNKSH